jgi:hypothetical protein
MRIGISLTSGRAVSDPRAGARWMVERTAAARQAGLDSLFVGDHHATPPLLPERAHHGTAPRRVGRGARGMPLPPPAVEPRAHRGAGGHAGRHRSGALHIPVRPGRRRQAVRGHGRGHPLPALRVRGVVRPRAAPAARRDGLLVGPIPPRARARGAAPRRAGGVLDRRQRGRIHRPRRASSPTAGWPRRGRRRRRRAARRSSTASAARSMAARPRPSPSGATSSWAPRPPPRRRWPAPS